MPFDVVTVPDFIGNRPLFELRTLLLLGSWLRNGGDRQSHPLHLACIGEPPASVRDLAEANGVRISVHAPVGAEKRGGSNKLRGLEVESLTGRILLIDTDVYVFNRLDALDGAASDLAACPADVRRLPESYWRRIYAGLGLPMPEERMTTLAGELMQPAHRDALDEKGRERYLSIVPYYNSGVVLVRQPQRLRGLWEDNIRRIAALFEEDDNHRRWLSFSDQAGLAVAVQQLRGEGASFEMLLPGANTRWRQAVSGAVSWDDAVIYHATGMFRPFPGAEPARLLNAVRQYTRERLETPPDASGEAPLQVDIDAARRFADRFRDEVLALVEGYAVGALSEATS